MLLSPITSADESYGELVGTEDSNELVHGETGGATNESSVFVSDLDGPGVPDGFGDWAVIPNIVEMRWSDKPVGHQSVERRLAVEWVFSSETDERRVTSNPSIRREFVSRVKDAVDIIVDDFLALL